MDRSEIYKVQQIQSAAAAQAHCDAAARAMTILRQELQSAGVTGVDDQLASLYRAIENRDSVARDIIYSVVGG